MIAKKVRIIVRKRESPAFPSTLWASIRMKPIMGGDGQLDSLSLSIQSIDTQNPFLYHNTITASNYTNISFSFSEFPSKICDLIDKTYKKEGLIVLFLNSIPQHDISSSIPSPATLCTTDDEDTVLVEEDLDALQSPLASSMHKSLHFSSLSPHSSIVLPKTDRSYDSSYLEFFIEDLSGFGPVSIISFPIYPLNLTESYHFLSSLLKTYEDEKEASLLKSPPPKPFCSSSTQTLPPQASISSSTQTLIPAETTVSSHWTQTSPPLSPSPSLHSPHSLHSTSSHSTSSHSTSSHSSPPSSSFSTPSLPTPVSLSFQKNYIMKQQQYSASKSPPLASQSSHSSHSQHTSPLHTSPLHPSPLHTSPLVPHHEQAQESHHAALHRE
ncbi:hypothetical protein ADUPG1_009962, partial [Aduncisulcus paluster]